MAERESVIYLDVDDEITSVASRIRAVDSGRVAVVVPPGSRIATSRINFRLLAREALAQGRRLAVVAPDGASRALAASAGLPVFGSVGEFESTSEPPPGAYGLADPTPEPRGAEPVADVGPGEGTIILPPVEGEGGAKGLPARAQADVPVAGHQVRVRRPRHVVLPIAGALVILALLVAGVAAYVVLPSATVVVTPRVETLGPVSFTVHADPAATAVDATNGVIPAQRLSFDLSATDTFSATGQRVEQAAATGSVRWTNCDPTASYRIPAGSVVRTRNGVRFTTTEPVFLPVAGINGTTLDCQSNSAGIKAADPGPDGNVDANAITVPPSTYNGNVIRVTNPAPTTGGVKQTFPRIEKKDVDAAQAALRKELSSQLDAKLGEPGAVAEGTTVFPATKKVSAPEPDVDPASLVGEEQDSFELTLTATGTVVAVDEAPLDDVAAARMRSSIRAGNTLVDGSIHAEVGTPTVTGETVAFPVQASASQVANLDPATLREAVRGRSIEDARAALAPYGSADITTWPSWVGSIPTLDQRLDVRVEPAGGGAPSASPGASTRPSPSPSPGSS